MVEDSGYTWLEHLYAKNWCNTDPDLFSELVELCKFLNPSVDWDAVVERVKIKEYDPIIDELSKLKGGNI